MLDSSLPPAVAAEILRRYADVLRVGRIRMNGSIVRWQTDSSTENQLHHFCDSFFSRLTELLPDMAASNPDILRFAAYWYCKSVSINYALVEVLLLLKQKVGVLCTIETRGEHGGLVEYLVDVQPGNLRASLIWNKGDNIVYRNPVTAETRVKGTLSCLMTEFDLPPKDDETPAYSLQMRLKSSLASHFVKRLACARTRDMRPKKEATIFIGEPLRSNVPLETFAELASRPSLSRSSGIVPAVGDTLEGEMSPRTREQEDGPFVGTLRVTILGARELTCGDPGLPAEELYAKCWVAGNIQRTRTADGTNPEWSESWDFLVTSADLRSEILVDIFCANRLKERGFMGRARVPVSVAMGSSGPVEVTESLGGVDRGRVQMELHLLPESPEQAEDATAERNDEMECTIEVGTNFSGSTPPSSADVGCIRVRPALHSPLRSFWCSRSCPS